MATTRGARTVEPAQRTRKRVRNASADLRVGSGGSAPPSGEKSGAKGNGASESSWAALNPLRSLTQLPHLAISPERVLELQQSYVQQLSSLWQDFVAHPEKAAEPIRDARFSDSAWQRSSWASFYARAYLLNAEFMKQLAESVAADRKTKERVKFAVSQWVDAASPSNFLALNPQAQERMLATKGESLTAGLANLMKDLGKIG